MFIKNLLTAGVPAFCFNVDPNGGGGGAPATPPAATPPADPNAAPAVATPPASPPATPPAGDPPPAAAWWEGVKEEPIRNFLKEKNYATAEDAARDAWTLSQQAGLSKDAVIAPKPDAPKEEWDKFHAAMGRPETPDKYAFEFPPDVKVDDGMLAFGKTLFHKMGLNNKQAQEAATEWNNHVAKMNSDYLAQQQAQNDTELAALETKFGADLEKNKAAALRVMKSTGIDAKLIERVEQNIGSAAVVEMLALIGLKSGEGSFVGNSNNGDPNDPDNMTKEQATAMFDKLKNDQDFQAKMKNEKNPAERQIALKYYEKVAAKAG